MINKKGENIEYPHKSKQYQRNYIRCLFIESVLANKKTKLN